jgi:hypothetical protein
MEEFIIEHIKDPQFPNELKRKSKKEIEPYITKKQKERDAINKEIQELNKKRRAYIAKEQKEKSNGLENAMINAIKTQAKKKNYQWN